jgi:RNA polymerase sigma-70 factor (ECF subfamily)
VDEISRLAIAARDGHDAALAEVIRRTQADVWRLCAHMAGRERADDLTQETFVRAWRSLSRFEARASFRTWVLTIARHTAIDALRAAARRPTTAALVPETHPVEPDPADIVTTNDLFAGLDPDRRMALLLTQLLGLSYEEAAAVCGVAVGTIRSRVSRGREDMVARLDRSREA